MIQLAIVTPDTSHVRVFTDHFATTTDIRVTSLAVQGSIRETAEIAKFADQRGLEIAASINDLPQVDGVLLLGADWLSHRELAEHFIAKDIRTFIDKPLGGSLEDVAWLEQHRTRGLVFGGSALPWTPDFLSFREEVTYHQNHWPKVRLSIHGPLESYFIATHSYELAAKLLEDAGDVTLDETDTTLTLIATDGARYTRIAFVDAREWSLRASFGKFNALRRIPMTDIYSGLLTKMASFFRGEQVEHDPALPVRLALQLRNTDHIDSDEFVRSYREKFGTSTL